MTGYGQLSRTACGSLAGLAAHQAAGETPCYWCAGVVPGVRDTATVDVPQPVPVAAPVRAVVPSAAITAPPRHYLTSDGVVLSADTVTEALRTLVTSGGGRELTEAEAHDILADRASRRPR